MADQDSVNDLLCEALAQFWQVATGCNPVLSAIIALDALGHAAMDADLPLLNPLVSAQLDVAIQRAAPYLADAAARDFSAEHIYLLMTGAAGLVAGSQPEMKRHHLLYLGLLKSELGVILCRQEIAAAGDPLVRNIAFNRASAATPDRHPVH